MPGAPNCRVFQEVECLRSDLEAYFTFRTDISVFEQSEIQSGRHGIDYQHMDGRKEDEPGLPPDEYPDQDSR